MKWCVEQRDAYELLERMVAECWKLEPLPPIERGAEGKPWMPAQPGRHFNVSHSGPLSLCTLSDCPVGADIERVRPRRPGLPAYVFSPTELAWYQERGCEWEDFYILWTMKEARVKCTGEGLRLPARDIAIPLPCGALELERDGFHYTLLSGAGWRGAICQQLLSKSESI